MKEEGRNDMPFKNKIRYNEWKRENRHKLYSANPEKYREKMRNYRAANPEKIAEIAHKSRIKNRAACQERTRKWLKAHPGKSYEYSMRWYESHKESYREAYRQYRANKLSAPGDGITTEQWEQLKDEYNHKCAYCGSIKPLALDHVIPLSRGGGHDISNAIPACKSCNTSKNNKPLLRWMYDRLNVGI